MAPQLYTELCERIIDFLHNDPTSLRACSLVSRSWVPASRSHLFADVVLSGTRSKGQSWAADTPCRRIYVNILSSPHLAAYVKSLVINEVAVTRASGHRWVCSEITFPPLLKKLAAVTALEFAFPPPCRTISKVSWSTLVFQEITDAVSNLPLHSFSLRHFSFHTLAQFVKLLDSFAGLKSLHLDNVDILTDIHWSNSALEHFFYPSSAQGALVNATGASTDTTEEHQLKSPIEHLTLKSDSAALFIPVLLHPRSPADLSNLRKLSATISVGDYSHFYDLLLHAPLLETLEIEIEPSFNYNTQLENKNIIDLSCLPSLKVFTLSVSLLLGRVDPVPFILSLFSTIPDINDLKELFLAFTIDKPPPSLTIQDFEDTLALWQGLDDLLTQSKFDHLNRIRLDFVLDNPIGDESVKSLSDKLVQQLDGLGKKGRLDFDMFELH